MNPYTVIEIFVINGKETTYYRDSLTRMTKPFIKICVCILAYFKYEREFSGNSLAQYPDHPRFSYLNSFYTRAYI